MKDPASDVEGVNVVPPPVVVLVPVRIVSDESGTRSEGPHMYVDASMP